MLNCTLERIALAEITDPKSSEHSRENFSNLLALLHDPETRLIRFDGEQAAAFYDMGEGAVARLSAPVKMPFDNFYIEFTPSMRMPLENHYHFHAVHQQLDWEDKDVAYVELVGGFVSVFPLVPDLEPMGIGGEGDMLVTCLIICQGVFGDMRIPARAINPFVLNLDTGEFYADALNLTEGADPSGWLPGSALMRGPLVSVPTSRGEGEYAGAAEREIRSYIALIKWLGAYMTGSKGIRLVSEPLPRPQRRRMKRKGIPNRWYVIKADRPVLSRSNSTGYGEQHGYRYDVRGHWRVTPSGPVWIRPHQRGLVHERYVPAERRFAGKREFAIESRQSGGVR